MCFVLLFGHDICYVLISFKTCDEVSKPQPAASALRAGAFRYDMHLTCPFLGSAGQSRSVSCNMDQREILLQNLERTQSKKLNQEAFVEEFLVSLLKARFCVSIDLKGTAQLPLPKQGHNLHVLIRFSIHFAAERDAGVN